MVKPDTVMPNSLVPHTVTMIPLDGQHVAKHFTKASVLAFFNEYGQEFARADNPVAASECCSARKKMMALMLDHKTQQVIVDRIGEKMLGKLLDLKYQVFSTQNNTLDAATLVRGTEALMPLLTRADGHVSPRAVLKESRGGSCGCNHDGHQHNHEHGATDSHHHGSCEGAKGGTDEHVCCGGKKNHD